MYHSNEQTGHHFSCGSGQKSRTKRPCKVVKTLVSYMQRLHLMCPNTSSLRRLEEDSVRVSGGDVWSMLSKQNTSFIKKEGSAQTESSAFHGPVCDVCL